MYSRQYPYGRRRFYMGFFFIGAFLLLAAVVMWLWNAILPAVLPANPLNYPQAMGLLVLCRILFGGLHLGRRGGPPHTEARQHAWKDKWMNMDEGERAKFKEAWRRRCAQGKDEQPGETI